MNLRKFLSIAALIPLVALAACGGGGEESGAPDAAPDAAPPAAAAPDLSNAGGITGTITFAGEAPTGQEISMAADPFCQGAHSSSVMSAPVLVDADGGLSNVVVHISGGLDNYTYEMPSDTPVLNQEGCMYSPHVIAVRAGQTFIIRNSDDTLHNVNVQPSNNPAFNQGQPVAGMEMEKVFENAEIGIPARCDVHPWMASFISVFEHPYYGISGADGGFSIDQLPPGDYVIEAWHETLGTQTQSVTVAPNETAEISITFGG